MKKQIAVFLSFVIALGGFVTPVHAQEYSEEFYGTHYVKYGDVDYDHAITAVDALIVLQSVVGKMV